MNPTLEQRLAARARPARRVWGYQRWDRLAFLHWAWDPAVIQRTLPPGLTVEGECVTYASQQRGDAQVSRFVYAPAGAAAPAEPGSLAFFLAERYRLFARRRDGTLLSGQVHHVPYPLAPATAETYDTRVLELAGFAAPGRPPDHVHTSRGVSVEVFALPGPRSPATAVAGSAAVRSCVPSRS